MGGGGQHFFFLTPRRCLPPGPLRWNLWTVPKLQTNLFWNYITVIDHFVDLTRTVRSGFSEGINY